MMETVRNHRRRRAGIRIFIVLASALLVFSSVNMLLAAAEDGHGAEGSKGWVATDTYKLMNFAVLAIGLFLLLRKPVAKALNDRIDGIKEQLSELEAQKAQAEQELAAYNQKFLQLDQEAEQIIEKYIQQGQEAKNRILEEARAAAKKLEEQAQRNIENEFEKTRARLQEEVFEQALARAEALIKQKISAEDQNRLVDDYLDKVVA